MKINMTIKKDRIGGLLLSVNERIDVIGLLESILLEQLEIAKTRFPNVKKESKVGPKVICSGKEGAIIYAIATPGWKKSDLQIYLKENGEIVVSGKVTETTNESAYNDLILGEKDFTLILNYHSRDIDTTHVKSEYKDGVLTITVEKPVPTTKLPNNRTITIN